MTLQHIYSERNKDIIVAFPLFVGVGLTMELRRGKIYTCFFGDNRPRTKHKFNENQQEQGKPCIALTWKKSKRLRNALQQLAA